MKRWLLLLITLCAPLAAHAATGDITAVRVLGTTCTASTAACNGWVAEIDITGLATGGQYDFGILSGQTYAANAKGSITCTSPTYDITGATGTASRTVYMTHALRKPTPNQATNDETAGGTLTIRVALSDYIYSVDTSCAATIQGQLYKAAPGNNAVSGLSVTNNSTITYAKAPPICRWAKPGYEKVTGDFVLEATCFSKWAKNKKPLAALVYTVSDAHSHTVTATVNDMTVSSWGGDQNAVLVYAATIPVATLTQGDVLTANFVAYPWFGNSTSITDSSAGTAPPSENLGPLKLLNDKSGTYGAAYVAVKTTGNNATCAANASQSTAEAATGCLDIGTAITKLTSFNNSTYGRNNPGGGAVLICAGSFSYPGTQPGVDQGAQDTYVTVTKCSTATQANAIINNGTNADIETQKIKITGITIDDHVAAPVATLVGRTATDVLWIDNNIINMPSDTAPIYSWKLIYATRNSVTALANGFVAFSTTPGAYGLVRGNSTPSTSASAGIAAHMYCSIGNKGFVVGGPGNGWIEPGDISGQATTDGGIYAFNSAYNINVQPIQTYTSGTTWAKGVAFVQNVIEKVTDTDPLIQIAADGNTATPVDNVLLWLNTLVGERANLAYNETGTTALFRNNWSVHGNLFFNWNIKTDTFTTANAARVGNWSQVYRVGDAGDDIQAQFGGVFFAPEFDGLYTLNQSVTIGFVNDKSFATGTAAGNGDYHLTSSSSFISRIPAGEAMLPFDITGAARRNAGNGAMGAYEFGSDPVIVPPISVNSSNVLLTPGAKLLPGAQVRTK
jgi:hypothetical protein